MTPAESRRVAALEQTVADLARRVGNARGLGVNTAFGATHYRTTQVGFPAELTSSWSASTGYSWKRLGLDGLDVTDPGIQLTGDKAVTPGNNVSLTAGAAGWLEPDPDARGWVFTQDTNAASSDNPLSNCLAAFVGWLEADCLRITVLAGADPGACSNITTVTLDATSPGGYVWTTDGTFEVPGGDATIEIYKKADGSPGATIHVWTGTAFESIEGVYVGCSGSSLEFAFPADPLLCDDEGVACGDNTVRVRAACITCPEDTCETTCDCAECPDGAPGSYTFTLAGGTDDFTGANGAWSLCLNAETCAWEAPRRRGGWNAVYTRVGTVGTLTLEYGGLGSGLYLTYQIDPVATDCFDPNALSAVDAGGTGSIPGAPTLTTPDTPIVCPVAAVPCCDPVILPARLYITFSESLAAMGTVEVTWDGTVWTSAQIDMCHNDAMRVEWYCVSGSTWALDWIEEGTSYPPAVGSILNDTTTAVCSPFSASGTGTNASNACNGGAPTTTYRYEVTE